MENARHSSMWERDRAARERHNAQRAHRRAERQPRERASEADGKDPLILLGQMLQQRQRGLEPDLSPGELALAEALYDGLAKEWQDKIDPIADCFIPQWIDMSPELEAELEQAAIEWGDKLRREEQSAETKPDVGDI